MKTKVIIGFVIALLFFISDSFAQEPIKNDDKLAVMNTIRGIPEISTWDELIEVVFDDVEVGSYFFGYSGYGLLEKGTGLHGVTVGASILNLMIDAEVRLGHVINSNASDFETTYNYLKNNSYQGSAMATIQLYLKYFSLGIGFGTLNELGKDVAVSSTNSYDSYSLETDIISYSSDWYFALRPTLRGYIPLSSDYSDLIVSLYLSAGYDIIPSNNRLNQWTFGVGLKFGFD